MLATSGTRLLIPLLVLLAVPTLGLADSAGIGNGQAAKFPHSPWSLEANIQAHSVAGPSSPWIGLGPLFTIVDSAKIGLRGFVPLTKPFDKSTYALQIFSRFCLARGENSEFFIEPSFAENFYTVLPFSSVGLGVGATDRVNSNLSVGISGGIEVSRVVVDSVGLERRDSLIIYPKISFLTNFNF